MVRNRVVVVRIRVRVVVGRVRVTPLGLHCNELKNPAPNEDAQGHPLRQQ